MKKFNKKMTLALFMSLCATSMSFALQKVTISVAATGADYTTILGAIQAAAAPTASTVLVNGDTIVVNVLEGTHTEPYVLIGNGLFASSKVLNVIVNGAGADKTILMGTSTGPTDANATNQRFWTLNDNTMGGTNLTFKNLTFSNYGGKTNANGANGAVIQFTPGLTPKAKINFINTVIKNCVGRALFISYFTNWDFNFENCLFKDNAILVAPTGQAM
ncbi:hypothetical protein JZU68_07840, partial [bacterium]|nr:hypothetical protein [bacterium]